MLSMTYVNEKYIIYIYYIYLSKFVVLVLKSINRVRSPISHSRKLAAEIRESLIVLINIYLSNFNVMNMIINPQLTPIKESVKSIDWFLYDLHIGYLWFNYLYKIVITEIHIIETI